MVGVFPEGTRHLGILPIAIDQGLTSHSASLTEVNTYGLPLGLQSFFEPSGLLFN